VPGEHLEQPREQTLPESTMTPPKPGEQMVQEETEK